MNDLLQKLETRAWAFADSEFDWENPQVSREQLFKKHFARLIVAECSSVAFKVAPSDESACDISGAIDKVFGDE